MLVLTQKSVHLGAILLVQKSFKATFSLSVGKAEAGKSKVHGEGNAIHGGSLGDLFFGVHNCQTVSPSFIQTPRGVCLPIYPETMTAGSAPGLRLPCRLEKWTEDVQGDTRNARGRFCGRRCLGSDFCRRSRREDRQCMPER